MKIMLEVVDCGELFQTAGACWVTKRSISERKFDSILL